MPYGSEAWPNAQLTSKANVAINVVQSGGMNANSPKSRQCGYSTAMGELSQRNQRRQLLQFAKSNSDETFHVS